DVAPLRRPDHRLRSHRATGVRGAVRGEGVHVTLAIMGLAIALLLFLRVPVGFAILGPCLGYLWLTDQSLGLSMRLAAQGVNSWPLLAIPLFVLVGVTANRAGIADRLFDFALALFGRVRGSLGYVNIGVS